MHSHDFTVVACHGWRRWQDNVKYLGTMEKFLEPLYRGSPVSLLDSLPALFNSMRMVYSVSRQGTCRLMSSFARCRCHTYATTDAVHLVPTCVGVSVRVSAVPSCYGYKLAFLRVILHGASDTFRVEPPSCECVRVCVRVCA